jgi:hypothetical protein
MAAERDGLRVAAAFDEQVGDLLGLRVEVANDTGERLDVDPRQFSFTPCAGTARETCDRTLRIVDPERVIADLEERRSRERADAQNSQTFLGTLAILSAFTDVAAIATGKVDRNTGRSTLRLSNTMRLDDMDNRMAQSALDAQQAAWSNRALRRTTLFPGHGTGGRVYIPIYLAARTVWLHVRTGGQSFSFPFHQTVTRLTQRRRATASDDD